MNLKVPVKNSVFEGQVKLVRRLAESGRVLVKTGETVNPEDVVAEGVVTSGFRSIPLAAALGVSRKQADKFLKVKLGERVYPEEILAKCKKFFSEVIVKSPVEGKVTDYDDQSGNLLIEFTTRKMKLTASCWGKVTKALSLGVEIETLATKISGVIGTGRIREGEFKVIGKPNEFLLPADVTPQLKGKIIFGGARITKAALGKAISLGVAGIVAGGINVDDFFKAGGGKVSPFGGSSDVGITLVILSGFGFVPVDGLIFEVFLKNEGKFALIDGDFAEVIIPKPKDDSQPVRGANQKPTFRVKEKILELGDIVKISDPANCGLRGKVVKMPTTKQKDPLGLTNYLVEIETQSGKMVQPVVNLEVQSTK